MTGPGDVERPIMPGAEPFFFDGSQAACLLSHGFTGTPQSLRELGEYLHRVGDLTVACPLLPGHGTSPRAMARSTAAEWRTALEGELRRLAELDLPIFVGGLSMGGTLALNLAARFPALVQGVISINAAMLENAERSEALDQPGLPAFLPGIGSDISQTGIREVAYDQVPVAALRQLRRLLTETRALLPTVTCPALIVQSRHDHVVAPATAEYIYDAIGSTDKRLVWLARSFHVATLDYDRERIATLILGFIQSHLG